MESLEDFGLMAAEQYTQDKLLELGKDNYKKLVSYCEILEVNGFWDQARQVMKKTSTQVLDLYVQSVLMNLAIHCGDILENQKDFIRLVTKTNPLSIPSNGDIEEKSYVQSRQYYECRLFFCSFAVCMTRSAKRL